MTYIKKNGYVLLIGCLTILILGLILINYRLNNKSVELDRVSLKNSDIVKSKSFAMFKKVNGSYVEETNSNSWPSASDWHLNFDNSGCVDAEGKTIENALSEGPNGISVRLKESVYCYLYFDPIVPDITLTYGTNALKKYNVSASCSTGTTATWDQKHSRLMFDTISSVSTSCNLTGSDAQSNQGTLISYIEDSNNHVAAGSTGIVDETTVDAPDYTTVISTMGENDYQSVSKFWNTSYSSTTNSGDISSLYRYESSDSSWNLTPDTANRYNHFQFKVNSNGWYQLCYTQGVSNVTTNTLYVYVNSTQQYFPNNSTSLSSPTGNTPNTGCVKLGYLTTSDNVRVAQRAMGTTMSTLKFIMQKVDIEVIDVGYRYEGGNPNNFVWFNNELWRIIGSVPVTIDVDNNGTTVQEEHNRVKIIRMDPIGGLSWNSSSNNTWTTTTPLYRLLNEYYYGARNDGQSYCIGYYTSEKSKCYYSEIGIKTTGRYASMIEDVYWNIGKSTNTTQPMTMYKSEIATKTSAVGKIGMMYGSDYGFAQSTSHTTNLSTALSGRGNNDWLYNGYEWTMTRYTTSNNSIYIHSGAYLGNATMYYSPYSVRPVLYLNPNVKVVSGVGTIESPYQITM